MRKDVLSLITAFVVIFSCTSCSDHKADAVNEETDTLCSCPHTTICLQPLDDFTQKEAEALKVELEEKMQEVVGYDFEIKIMPSKKLSAALLNDAKTRYRADKIIRMLEKQTGKGETTIGLTHKDISTSIRGHKDWGVMGLSFRPGKAFVISTFRVKPRSQFWKVAVHEFLHTFAGLPHCSSGDPHCIMQDCKGGNPLKRETRLCEACQI